MEREERNKIAYALLKNLVAKEGIQFRSMKRELGNLVTQTGIPLEKLKIFFALLLEDLVNENFKIEEE